MPLPLTPAQALKDTKLMYFSRKSQMRCVGEESASKYGYCHRNALEEQSGGFFPSAFFRYNDIVPRQCALHHFCLIRRYNRKKVSTELKKIKGKWSNSGEGSSYYLFYRKGGIAEIGKNSYSAIFLQ
ncbi:hypothetical protein GTNG_0033 [Geobacillus thermodenitrificans NG80-2]|uniref:Uncharacterized protein n=1 Tax=Geobacillus thermodenitrificans (strain NG80-2) TaxID=420246 RepID=A4IJB6_GEOTN|nr:hypothetical protein GTNG_0033 [Geobacillus thermodenitrificans NG80-2]